MTTRRRFLGAGGVLPFSFSGPGMRSAQSNEVSDVTAFGAVGDGETDDRGAIQRAVDAAQEAGGGVVFFPAGEYLLGTELDLEELQDIWFSGSGTSSVLKAPPTVNFVTMRLQAPRRVRISHLRFVGVPQGSTVAVRGADATDLEIADCMMELGNSGVRAIGRAAGSGTRNLRVVQTTVRDMTGSGAGIIVGPYSRDILIANNIIDGVGEEGISLDGSGFGDDALQPRRATIVGNRVSRTGRVGIAVYRASDVTVSGNVVSGTGPGFAGIGVSSDSDAIVCRHVSVADNVIEDAGEDGIRLRDVRYFSVVGNVVRDIRGGDGIGVGGAADAEHGTITANVIVASGGVDRAGIRVNIGYAIAIVGNHVDQANRPGTYGLRIQAGSHLCTVIGNQCLNAEQTGIEIDAADTVAVGNQASGEVADLVLRPESAMWLGNLQVPLEG